MLTFQPCQPPRTRSIWCKWHSPLIITQPVLEGFWGEIKAQGFVVQQVWLLSLFVSTGTMWVLHILLQSNGNVVTGNNSGASADVSESSWAKFGCWLFSSQVKELKVSVYSCRFTDRWNIFTATWGHQKWRKPNKTSARGEETTNRHSTHVK